jgi:hypothetical protein
MYSRKAWEEVVYSVISPGFKQLGKEGNQKMQVKGLYSAVAGLRDRARPLKGEIKIFKAIKQEPERFDHFHWIRSYIIRNVFTSRPRVERKLEEQSTNKSWDGPKMSRNF